MGGADPTPQNGLSSAARSATRAVAMLAALVVLVAPLEMAPSAPAGADVRVRPGATLSQIAHTYGTSVSALAAANGIADPNKVVAGTVLRMPATTTTAGAASPVTPTTVVLTAGDSLWALANRFGTTVAALDRANGISDPDHVLIGARIVVPQRPTTVAVVATGGSGTTSARVTSSTLPSGLVAHPGRRSLLPAFQQWAERFGVPASLLEAMCWWESGWQMTAVSSTGAVGIGQLEPSTVRTLRSTLRDRSLDPTVTSDNIEMAAAYLHLLLRETAGNESLALAAYNQGLSSVRAHGILPSTEQYVQGILSSTSMFS